MLIQITQNLATRIRNSHAFNLPTFYLPREDGEPCAIPNAIEEVCKEIDKSINMTVQKNLRLLKEDCERILARCDVVQAEDKVKKAANLKATLKGLAFMSGAWVSGALLVALLMAHVAPSVCKVADQLCTAAHVQALVRISPAVQEHFGLVGVVLTHVRKLPLQLVA